MMTDNKIALVFPGQGCQFVGMGREIYDNYAQIRTLFAQADDILGLRLSDICFSGPDEVLGDTANTQPAIYLVTMALWQLLAPKLESIRSRLAYVAGHSLGEYSALAASGAISFAGAEAPGGMAVIIGLDDDTVYEIVQAAGAGVWVANLNSPGQVVIAGQDEPLRRALALAKEHKARRALALSVSVACHTPLMSAAADRLGAALSDTQFVEPWLPIVSNVEATSLSAPDQIRTALIKQLSSPVRWVESVQMMAQAGVTATIEIGPKSVVTGLVRRIDRGIKTHSVTDLLALDVFDAEAI